MKIIIEINMDNAAFEENPEVELARILAHMSERYKENNVYAFSRIRDINGNTVGSATVIED
jgi:hypothetical protein